MDVLVAAMLTVAIVNTRKAKLMRQAKRANQGEINIVIKRDIHVHIHR
jgi:hypothetical protein